MKRTRICRRSPSKAEDDAKYRKAKAEYQKEHPDCEMPGCRRSLRRGDLCDLHHKAGRNGPLLYLKQFFATLCRKHHNFVEEHSSWSRANGWIIDLSSEEVWNLKQQEILNQ